MGFSKTILIDEDVRSSRKIEDGDTVRVYKWTNLMLADIGKMALPDAQFEYLRDQMNGVEFCQMSRLSYNPQLCYLKCSCSINAEEQVVMLRCCGRISDVHILAL